MLPPSADTLEKKIRYKFKNRRLLEEALTHKSLAMEQGSRLYNERLEFLGDAVLGTAVAHYFFKRYPNDDEGKLSKIKSQLVSRATLVEWAKGIELGQYLLMSAGEESTGGRTRESITANAFEALIGAIFLDAGFAAAQRLITRHLAKRKRFVETDYKSQLQEIIQKKSKVPPEYRVFSEKGPDHAKIFMIEARTNKRILGRGEGHSKKEAEQAAARDSLKKLRNKSAK